MAKRKPARQIVDPEWSMPSTGADFDHSTARVVSDGPRKVGPAIEKPARLRSRAYLDDVATQPCAGCGKAGPSHPHHVLVRGRRDDTFDLTAIPLCPFCHRWAHQAAQIKDPTVLHRMLGAYLCRRLPQLKRSELAAVLRELLTNLEA